MSTGAGGPPERMSGHAYPWDVLGDPSFAPRVRDLGFSEVTLAAAYHAVRAATPLHPDRQIVDAPWAALYRPISTAWQGRRLVPRAPAWVPGKDSFAVAAEVLRDAGLDVNAWIVLDHGDPGGSEDTAPCVVNCLGEQYPYALCPRQDAVREYTALLAREAVRDSPARGVTLESWGQLGVVHGSLHDKTAGAFDREVARLLSICCCGACRAAWADAGGDPDRIVAALRADVVRRQRDESGPGLPDETLGLLRDTRIASAAASLDGVLETLPADLEVRVFGGADPWAGASVESISEASLARVGTVVQGAWATGGGAADAVRALRAALPDRIDVAAYVSVLPPVEHEDLAPHVSRLRAAGASAWNVYHLGLAGLRRLGWMRALLD